MCVCVQLLATCAKSRPGPHWPWMGGSVYLLTIFPSFLWLPQEQLASSEPEAEPDSTPLAEVRARRSVSGGGALSTAAGPEPLGFDMSPRERHRGSAYEAPPQTESLEDMNAYLKRFTKAQHKARESGRRRSPLLRINTPLEEGGAQMQEGGFQVAYESSVYMPADAAAGAVQDGEEDADAALELKDGFDGAAPEVGDSLDRPPARPGGESDGVLTATYSPDGSVAGARDLGDSLAEADAVTVYDESVETARPVGEGSAAAAAVFDRMVAEVEDDVDASVEEASAPPAEQDMTTLVEKVFAVAALEEEAAGLEEGPVAAAEEDVPLAAAVEVATTVRDVPAPPPRASKPATPVVTLADAFAAAVAQEEPGAQEAEEEAHALEPEEEEAQPLDDEELAAAAFDPGDVTDAAEHADAAEDAADATAECPLTGIAEEAAAETMADAGYDDDDEELVEAAAAFAPAEDDH